MDSTEIMLKELTEAHGVPGYESLVRSVVKRYLEPLGELSQDKIGSVICKKKGSMGETDAPRVMLAGHMDEIGFMVKLVTEDGFVRFLPLGGWFDQVLLGQRVVVNTAKGNVLGVIGAKPPHLLSPDERKKVVEKKDMYIDIGASSKEEALAAGVRPGDPIVPMSSFEILANSKTYLAKAFDDRVGTALVISVLQEVQKLNHPNTIYGVATVMEEVGLRGATTSVRAVDPDVAIVFESDIAGDVPGIKPEESSVKLGKGPTVLIYDTRMIPNLRLRDLVMNLAEELDIPLQISAIEGGATDGAAIHLHGLGVPTVVIGVAARHIHSDSSIIHRDDYDRAVRLMTALMQRLDMETVKSLTD
jgi:putative aminopeptidase FrvX